MGFVKRRSRRGRSTPTAGRFVTYKADAEQTGTVTVAAAEALIRA